MLKRIKFYCSIAKKILNGNKRCFCLFISLKKGVVRTAINEKTNFAENILTQFVLFNLKFIEIVYAPILTNLTHIFI